MEDCLINLGDTKPARQPCFCMTAILYDPPCLNASCVYREILANDVSRVSLFNIYDTDSSSMTLSVEAEPGFNNFNGLPAELQHRIWQMVVREPTIICVGQ